MQRKHYLLLTGLYLLFVTALLLAPSGYFPRLPGMGLDKAVHFVLYLVLSWLMLAALGKCPLRWRGLAPWVFVIVASHAYWMEFLQSYWPAISRHPSYVDFAFGAVGGLSGILLRLRYSYKKCNCQVSVSLHKSAANAKLRPFTGMNKVPALTTHHPKLPGIVAEAFGWKALTVDADEGWQLGLVCTGKSLVSLPHFSYGALHAIPELADPVGAVKSYMHRMHFDKGFAGIEYRQTAAENSIATSKVASWLQLAPSFDLQWHGFSSNLRRKINKASRNGFVVEQGGMELLDAFYHVYARHLAKLGSAALTKRFFRLMLEKYDGGYAGIFLIRQQKKIVGGAFNLAYEGFYENGWFATLHSYQGMYASYLLHKAMIEHAIKLGCHTYSFGRSTHGGGVHFFKKQWGAYDVPLPWLSYPEAVINVRKQGWLRKIWKQIPYPLGMVVGRYVAKWVY